MRAAVLSILLSCIPVLAFGQSSIFTTTGNTTVTSSSTVGGTTTTTSSTNANSITGTGGSIYTTRNGNVAYDNRIGSAYAPGTNNPYKTRDASKDAPSDVDTPRKGFDDPRDPWDGRYNNDNPNNYSNGRDDLAAHAAARDAFVGRNAPANYTRGGVTYGPVHSH